MKDLLEITWQVTVPSQPQNEQKIEHLGFVLYLF